MKIILLYLILVLATIQMCQITEIVRREKWNAKNIPKATMIQPGPDGYYHHRIIAVCDQKHCWTPSWNPEGSR